MSKLILPGDSEEFVERVTEKGVHTRSDRVVIHIANKGKTLCGIDFEVGAPLSPGHVWVTVPRAAMANCEQCLKAYAARGRDG